MSNLSKTATQNVIPTNHVVLPKNKALQSDEAIDIFASARHIFDDLQTKFNELAAKEGVNTSSASTAPIKHHYTTNVAVTGALARTAATNPAVEKQLNAGQKPFQSEKDKIVAKDAAEKAKTLAETQQPGNTLKHGNPFISPPKAKP